ncbi:Protein of unknown function NKWYS [Thalassoporum mexicanum PCC 7367]|uniref:putative capsular polysaccharide synthesis family protein n=1 Tax=Thalassoporum mexicanum TaxID=3457544 RepID=UPI00029FB625|nr:putative capsular polysaccharide synthesis family protein [Pseudanabaena sp. PCC 7367]AFY69764.1 Protein of unknown function NKWYS [Pseudanabaena sp. PCC 7367]
MNLKALKQKVKNLKELFLYDLKIGKATPVLLYQMGKVGSLSIYYPLRKQYPGFVGHCHYFPNNPDAAILKLYNQEILNSRPLNVISLTREPIARNISAFFQNLERYVPNSSQAGSLSIQELSEIFLAKYEHQTPLVWFHRSSKDLGIDIYAQPFPDNGIAEYHNQNIRLLIIRSELSNQEKEGAIAKFLGLESFKIENANIGSQKDYAQTYQEFRAKLILPHDYLQTMSESQYFNHFYSQEFIEATISKWRSRLLIS